MPQIEPSEYVVNVQNNLVPTIEDIRHLISAFQVETKALKHELKERKTPLSSETQGMILAITLKIGFLAEEISPWRKLKIRDDLVDAILTLRRERCEIIPAIRSILSTRPTRPSDANELIQCLRLVESLRWYADLALAFESRTEGDMSCCYRR